MKDVYGTFTMDAIASIAFGVSSDSLNNTQVGLKPQTLSGNYLASWIGQRGSLVSLQQHTGWSESKFYLATIWSVESIKQWVKYYLNNTQVGEKHRPLSGNYPVSWIDQRMILISPQQHVGWSGTWLLSVNLPPN